MIPPPSDERYLLKCKNRLLDCRQYHVMGILNVTPDSFYDGGRYFAVDQALHHVERMLSEGAAIIDVGGESTRPSGSVYGKGAVPVDADEERARVLPVIQAISDRFPEAMISIDTYKPAVAREALAAGASMVNDVTGLRRGDGMARVAAEADVPLVLMHSVGEPGAMPHEQVSRDIVHEVTTALGEAAGRAEEAGARQIVVDPGFGFGKSATENLRLVGSLDQLRSLDRPVMIGISRKSTIGNILGTPPEERLFGSLGATAIAVLRGASIVRTHDVRPTVDMLRVIDAVLAACDHEESTT